jgi:hypothetical protein
MIVQNMEISIFGREIFLTSHTSSLRLSSAWLDCSQKLFGKLFSRHFSVIWNVMEFVDDFLIEKEN